MEATYQIENLNDVEQMYLYNLDQIKNKVNDLIAGKENISSDIHNTIYERRNNFPIIYTDPFWHNYLVCGQYTLSGDYPDEESVDNAISHGNRVMLSYCIDELSILSVDLLEEALVCIKDHYYNHTCKICKLCNINI